MSMFFEYPASRDSPIPEKDKTIRTSWSSGESPVLAVAYQSGVITFHNEEGEQIVKPYESSSECTVMAWHPKLAILIIGFKSGSLVIWSPRGGVMKEFKTHKSKVLVASWSPSGNRLVSADKGGVIAVWSPRSDGVLKLLCRYAKEVPITHAVFSVEMEEDRVSGSCPPFFLAGDTGEVFFADDEGHCTQILNIEGGIMFMHHTVQGNYLVILTKKVVLLKYSISDQMQMTQDRKVKLSVRGSGIDLQCASAGQGLLAASNSENIVRVWDLGNSESYVLVPPLFDEQHRGNDVIRTIAYNPTRRLLTAGSSKGRVFVWRFIGTPGAIHDESAWFPVSSYSMPKGIYSMDWANGSHGLISVRMKRSATILSQHRLLCQQRSGNGYVQLSKTELKVYQELDDLEAKTVYPVSTKVRITHVDIDSKRLLVSDGNTIEIYNISNMGVTPGSSFVAKSRVAKLKGDSVFVAFGKTIRILSLEGVQKTEISFTEEEGVPIRVDVWDKYLAVVTKNGFLRLLDISLRSPRIVVPKTDLKMPNSIITMVAMLRNIVDSSGVQQHDNQLHVYDVELDRTHSYKFGLGRQPVSVFWEPNESNMLVVQLNTLENQMNKSKMGLESNGEDEKSALDGPKEVIDGEIVTMFATSDYGILLQDSFHIPAISTSLMGIQVPHICLMHRKSVSGNAKDGVTVEVKKRTMRDFMGLEKISKEEKKNLIKFSYYLTIGNMTTHFTGLKKLDEAYRAVKRIESQAIWKNMAHSCVKSKRVDVARVCLGNMHDARGAQAVRACREVLEEEAAIFALASSPEVKTKHDLKSINEMKVNVEMAMMAIQLGMLEDAEKLYIECDRYDLLVQLYCASGKWEKALQVCEKHDRIHLKTTHYRYAHYLEGSGDLEGAMKHYEMAGAHLKEIPRMLYYNDKIERLGKYIKDRAEKPLFRWWAQYCASAGDFQDALNFYRMAEDWLSAVKVLVHLGDVNEAKNLVLQSNDASAAFHLGRHLEESEDSKAAIEFYKMAKRYNHGVRLAMELGLEDAMVDLALKSHGDRGLQLQVGSYFENRGMNDKAVVLYQKGGDFHKAISLCFESKLYESLRVISEEFTKNTDTALLNRVGDFFMDNNQYDKAVQLFITAGRQTEALVLCQKHAVRLTDKMAEALTPPKTKDPKEAATRKKTLLVLAECLLAQGLFHLACKKYTQAGDKILAMKSLLKSNDTDKIIYYATMTKKKEIYVLAGNYLQSQDWRNNAELMKRVILFYSKAKAYEKLANFYDSCGQLEIDEYRDYVKALGAMKEALKYMQKSKAVKNKEAKLGVLMQRTKYIESFVRARSLLRTNHKEFVQVCESLLIQPNVEQAVRVGDVYAVLTEYYFNKDDMNKAYEQIEAMRNRKITVGPYLDSKTVRTICLAVGVYQNIDGKAHPEDGIGEEIQEGD
ncbi:hypothetical protein AAMO2058_000447200 [Amorphochlora amoebiformis]